MLDEAGFAINDYWLTNPYKVRPPDNKLNRLKEYGIPNEIFEEQFFEELSLYKPTIIITAGKTPTNLLCPQTTPKKKKKGEVEVDEEKEGFGQWRGSLLRSPLLKWDHYVIPVYHPAYVLRNWAERQVSVHIYAKAFEELAFFANHGRLNPLPERRLQDSPSYDEVVGYLIDCFKQREPLSIDIELLFNRKLRIRYPYIFGIAKSPWDALAFTLWDYEGSRQRYILRLVNAILTHKRQIGQNFTTFDCHWLRAIGLRPRLNLVSDTLVRHHTLWPELPHTLAFTTMQYTREPYYKDTGKVWPAGANASQIRRYCCKDCCVTYEVHNEQEKEFVRVG